MLFFNLFLICVLYLQTYCVDSQVADSACSATAFLCGVKTDIDTIGIDANVIENNCSTQNQPENHVDSIMKWAQVFKVL